MKGVDYPPAPETPAVAHGMMTLGRRAARRWLREQKKRGGLSALARALVA